MMQVSAVSWKKWFLFCLGLFSGSAFCMKWMEGDLIYNGSLFTIIGLEITYPAAKVSEILSGIGTPVKTILRYHLYFDFVFMAGLYPGIACLCMLVRRQWAGKAARALLLTMALLQPVAWLCDIAENWFLLNWVANPAAVSQVDLFHGVVYTKWLIALTGVLLVLLLFLLKPGKKPAH
jgi:hypothetical protein